MSEKISRRDLFKTGAVATIAATLVTNSEAKPAGKSMIGVPFEKRDKVRFGIIGSGERGTSMIQDFLGIENLEIKAICDNVKANAEEGRAMIEKAGRPAPELYTDGDYAFQKLVARDDIDFVYIATPWEWHAPQAIAAMEAGKHVGVEVPMATTMKDIWKLVETSERTRKHCLMLENCCFNYNELLVLNMVRDDVFGDLTHAEAAYIHDLRWIVNEGRSEGLWRRAWHTRVNGNLYPTHGLGPVANYLDINRGDRFDYLVSVSSPQRSLDAYREKTEKKDSPKWREKYICGDMNTSIIKTAKGVSIMLQHDVSTPRPYTRHNHIQGTKGAFTDFPGRLYLDGQEGGHKWTTIEKVKDKYEHWLWKKLGEKARGAGHGGMDFVMAWRIVQYFNEGLVPDNDVYDGASWTAPFPMSAESVAKGSMPIKFPDFTRGRWSEKRAMLA
ncbi:MAG: Gfo/Idh/MocA family oxidoreductase [Acidobacteria bacterium]|nr:Gfo/Idh/MocA family oxidoreductase [Acidobacteriota bacterium]MBK8810609.1 Gfo/Idh/MocA family oxidoreductase [Acidobacteriota bacterium]